MAPTIRVVHITTVPESLPFLDGQLAYLRERGFEFAAISSPGSLADAFAERQGIEVVGVPMSRKLTPLADLRALGNLVREIRRLRPAIVHAHTPKGGLLGTVAAVIAGVPVRIYHMRGLPLETATGTKRTMLRWTERIACAAAHQVLCVSNSLRESALRERLAPAAKLRVLAQGSGQGVDAATKFNPARGIPGAGTSLRDRLAIPRDAVVIGFLGRIAREKGIGELVAAFESVAKHPGVHLLIAGDNDVRDSGAEALARAASKNPRIHVVPHHPDAPALYAAIDIVALPTYREGFPNVALEAAAMRRPIVATRVSGCVDAVVDGETGFLVAPRDPGALAAALERYVEDASLRGRHGEAARERALATFTREGVWHAVHDLYRELAIEAPRPTYDRIKRAFDVTLSAALLSSLAIPMVAIGAAVALNMGRPAVFSQPRPGKDERLFRMFKFRTMTDERDASGEFLPDRARITPLGTFLRRTSLDELPELFNVLRGEMSFVGPRPLLVRYLPYYTVDERLRHRVSPGITGLAQLHGRNQVSWDERLSLDVSYYLRRSIRLDLALLLRTVRLVLRREGVVVDPRSTMLNFDEERIARAATAGRDRADG